MFPIIRHLSVQHEAKLIKQEIEKSKHSTLTFRLENNKKFVQALKQQLEKDKYKVELNEQRDDASNKIKWYELTVTEVIQVDA